MRVNVPRIRVELVRIPLERRMSKRPGCSTPSCRRWEEGCPCDSEKEIGQNRKLKRKYKDEKEG